MIQGWIDAIRRNHGLEHATVAVMIARHGPSRLAGRASSDGFFSLVQQPVYTPLYSLARHSGGMLAQSAVGVRPRRAA